MAKKIISFVFAIVVVLGGMYFLKGEDSPSGAAVSISTEEFKAKCLENGNMFMTMGPVKNGIPTGEPACPGCMFGNGHYCDYNEYLAATDKG